MYVSEWVIGFTVSSFLLLSDLLLSDVDDTMSSGFLPLVLFRLLGDAAGAIAAAEDNRRLLGATNVPGRRFVLFTFTLVSHRQFRSSFVFCFSQTS